MRLAALPILLLLPLGPALAGNGRIEINQTSVPATGFPISISVPGSYLLTSDIVVSGEDLLVPAAITIDADDVTLDLNGFAIRTTPGADSHFGIKAELVGPQDTAARTTLINGQVHGFLDACVSLGADTRVEGLVVSSCGGDGISTGPRSLVLGNRVSACGAFGLRLMDPSSFSNNVLALNGLGTGAGGPFAGGTSGGGNVCDSGACPAPPECTAPPKQRYYLTPTSHAADQALTACAEGFHMASLYEMVQPSALQYDTTLGLTTPDSGQGPPTELLSEPLLPLGWVRGGAQASSAQISGVPGASNCNAWTEATSAVHGSVATVWFDWTETGVFLVPFFADFKLLWPWFVGTATCDFPGISVWCVHD